MTPATSLAGLLGVDDHEPRELLAALRASGYTVAAAESLTAGLLTALLTEVPGSSDVVRGGLVVYATELKTELAGVSAELLAERGAVHPEVAVELARGARDRCGASIGVGLTGVAGPDPQDGVPAGVVHIAVVTLGRDGDEVVRAVRLAERSDRSGVRAAAVRAALSLLSGLLTDRVTGVLR